MQVKLHHHDLETDVDVKKVVQQGLTGIWWITTALQPHASKHTESTLAPSQNNSAAGRAFQEPLESPQGAAVPCAAGHSRPDPATNKTG